MTEETKQEEASRFSVTCESRDDYSKTIRTLWHGLYAEMERHGVSVLASVADYQLLHGEQIDYLDWIEQNGHLELAIRCAFALWPERKTAA